MKSENFLLVEMIFQQIKPFKMTLQKFRLHIWQRDAVNNDPSEFD